MAIELPIIGDQSVRKQLDEILYRISFGSTSGEKAGNFDGEWIQFTSASVANNENTIAHNLDRVPTGYIVGQRNGAGILYNGSTTWTDTNIYLKCDASSITFRIFVW